MIVADSAGLCYTVHNVAVRASHKKRLFMKQKLHEKR